jgi:hypothetical protein
MDYTNFQKSGNLWEIAKNKIDSTNRYKNFIIRGSSVFKAASAEYRLYLAVSPFFIEIPRDIGYI